MATKRPKAGNTSGASSQRKASGKATRARPAKPKPTRGNKTTTKRIQHNEPVVARVMQAMLLLAGTLLLLSVLLGPTIGPLVTGILIFVTAIPPVRGPIDAWLVGARKGVRAQQAAAARMVIGLATILLALLGLLRVGV
jgi:hypothetical protein